MIGGRITRSSTLLVLAQLLAKSLDLIALIILARFLTPDDFGVIALATSVMIIANSLTEIPVIEAIIRNERIDQEDIDSAFTLTALRGLIIAVALVVIADPFAALFHEERLKMIMMVMALAPLFQGLASPNIAHALKALSYGVVAKSQLIGKSVSFVMIMFMAWFTQSYWAVVVGLVANSALTAIATHVFAPYLPRVSTKRFGLILNFAVWVTLSRMVFTLNQHSDKFFIAAVFGKTKLGFYSMAGDLSSVSTFMIATPITQPLFAAFSAIGRESDQLRSAYLRSQQILFTFVAPIGFLFAALAEPFVRLVLGEKWLDTAPLIQWLAPAIALQILIIPTHALVMAMNRPKVLVLREVLSLVLRLPATLAAAWWFGLVAAVAVRSIASALMVLTLMSIARHMVGATLVEQLSNCARAFVSISLMVAAAVLLDRLVPMPASFMDKVTEFVGISVISIAIYLTSLFGLWKAWGQPNSAERWMLDILKRKLAR